MPKGIYKHKKLTNEVKSKISNSLKGNTNRLGTKAWNKGLTVESDIRVRNYVSNTAKTNKGKECKLQTKKKLSMFYTGEKEFTEFKTPEYKRRRNIKDFKWRKKVRDRDVVCQITGKKTKCLVHHLEGYMQRPDLRYDVSNGVLILEEMHKKFHIEFGTRSFTKEDFLKFKEANKNG